MTAPLTERSVALQHLEVDDLDGQLRNSLTELSILGRKASAEIRIRLLPMLKEVKRRYDAGETISKVKGYHDYLRSLGLTPSTVRSWQKRSLENILAGVLKSTDKEIYKEEKKYERDLENEIEFDVDRAKESKEQKRKEKEYKKRLKEDPEFKRQEEEKHKANEKRYKEWQEEVKKRLKDRANQTHDTPHHMHFSGVGPPAADIKEFANLGRRAAANKYHPDRGGDAGRMAQLNHVADWLEKIAGAA